MQKSSPSWRAWMPTATPSRAENGTGNLPPSGPLGELPAQKKLERLLRVARGRRHALVLTHDNPDPDCIAAAVGLAQVLEKRAGVETRVGYGGIVGRSAK